jgi:hypothetical protein
MTNYSISSIGFAINVTSVTQVNITPVRKDIVNRFDEHGDLITLDRLPSENNVDFRNRILDIGVHRGGPTYEGLLNNLARELGCQRYHAITIDLTEGSDGSPLAPNARVDILADQVILYSNWQSPDNYTIDSEINIYDKTSEGFLLYQLINEINNSEYFTASIENGVRTNIHSTNLVRDTSYDVVLSEPIFGYRQHKFSNYRIISGTLWFSEKKNVFNTQVSITPTTEGEYYIDYNNNYVITYSIPSGEGICGYAWNQFPMKVDASLIHIYSLQDENFTKKLFKEEETEAGTVYGLPNTEGSEIYHQLFKEVKTFWGK